MTDTGFGGGGAVLFLACIFGVQPSAFYVMLGFIL